MEIEIGERLADAVREAVNTASSDFSFAAFLAAISFTGWLAIGCINRR